MTLSSQSIIMSDTDGGIGGTPFSPEQLAFITELVSFGVSSPRDGSKCPGPLD